MTINKVEKFIKDVSKADIIKYQLITYCFMKNLTLSDSDLTCIGELAILGQAELHNFCNLIQSKKIFKSPQSARNSINKAEKSNLIVKEGKNKKLIYINPNIKLQVEGSILLNYKLLSIESEES